MKAKVEVIVEREETATEQLARGVEQANTDKRIDTNEVKANVETALKTEYDDATVYLVE